MSGIFRVSVVEPERRVIVRWRQERTVHRARSKMIQRTMVTRHERRCQVFVARPRMRHEHWGPVAGKVQQKVYRQAACSEPLTSWPLAATSGSVCLPRDCRASRCGCCAALLERLTRCIDRSDLVSNREPSKTNPGPRLPLSPCLWVGPTLCAWSVPGARIRIRAVMSQTYYASL